MPRLREDGKNCVACFLKGCDCECDTCTAARQRNSETSQRVLDILNIADALTIRPEETNENLPTDE